MTLQKRITGYQTPSRILKYDSPLTQCNLYTVFEHSPIDFTRQKLRETTVKEGVSKRQMSAQLSASKVKKNDPTLPTWNTWKTINRLFQFKESTLQVVRTDNTRSNFKTRKKDPTLTNAS